ncbi:kinase-like domain-containing protein [Ilyonectria destructans]|nr:kinase-like domain-containing protein [Ilyonectria destructans]
MAQRDKLPEIVRDSELSTTFQSSITIHTKPSSRRNAPNQERWRHVKILGHGGYGEVWLQRRESSGSPKLRALKHIRISDRDSGPRGYIRELEALAKFSQDRYNEFFVKFYGWYEYNGFLHIATEFCEHGDLRAYLKNVGRLPEDQAQDIAAQVLGGLIMMHKAKFAHRDIKPANILIKSKPPDEWWVKVCDLGLSKRTEGVPGSTTVRGTPGFMAPETAGFHDDPRSVNPCLADMWCFGETVFQMLTGSGTFSNLANLVHYSKGDVEFPAGGMEEANASEDAVDFVKSLMKVNPNERLEAAKAQDHPWMASFQNQVQDLQESGPSDDRHHQETGPSYLFSPDQSTEASAAWTDLPSSGSITEGSVAEHSPSDQLTEASAAWTTMENQNSWPTPVTSPSLDTNVEQISRSSLTSTSSEIGTPPSRASEKVTDLFVTEHDTPEADTETLKPEEDSNSIILPKRPRLPA